MRWRRFGRRRKKRRASKKRYRALRSDYEALQVRYERLAGGTHDESADKPQEVFLGEEYVRNKRSRSAFYARAAAFTPTVEAQSEEGRFLLPTHGMGSIGQRLFSSGSYAGDALPSVMAAVREAGAPTRSGGTIVDVGANIGTVVIPAVRRYGWERGVAFEAHPENAHFLRLNLMHSGVDDRVRAFEMALGAKDGTASMRAEGTSGTHRISRRDRAPTADRGSGTVEVPMARLDTLIGRGELDASAVTLLWMDVQGYEAAVLQGASTVLEEPPPVVVEFSPRHLRAYGELGTMIDLIQENFTDVVDVKATLKSSKLSVSSVERLPEIAEQLGDGFTDLALVRLDRE